MVQCSGVHPQEEFEDTKGAIRIRKSKDKQTIAKGKRTKGQIMINKTYI